MPKSRTEAKPGDARPQWLSTTGGGGPAARAAPRGRGVVELRRTAAPAAASLPETLQLGGGWPDAVTVGRHEENGAVLKLNVASKVHCQFVVRTFHVPQRDEIYEALFLCDVSKHQTFVNGTPAFRPWHWVQDGDSIGLPSGGMGADAVLDFYKVHYSSLHKLPSNLVTIPSSITQPPSQPARDSKLAGKHSGQKKVQKGRRAGWNLTGAGAPAADVKGALQQKKGQKPRTFSEEILGRIIDLRYIDPPATYRMLVVHYDREQRWHHVDSNGLSTWDGESFTDEIDLNQMYAQGLVTFIDGNEVGGAGPRRPAKKAKRR